MPFRLLHGLVSLRRFPFLSSRSIVHSASAQPKSDSKQEIQGFPIFPLEIRRRKRRRLFPSDPDTTLLTTKLSYFLRHGAEAHGLNIRPDGWVPLREVLSQPGMQGSTLEQLQKTLDLDPQKRIELREERVTKGASMWWIRATSRHSIPSVNPAVRLVKSPNQVGAVLFCIHLSKWKSISEHGIWPERDDSLIHFVQSIPENYGAQAQQSSMRIVVQINLAKAMGAGLQFFVTNDHSVVTGGDYRGCVGPEFFQKATQIVWEVETLHEQGP
ncbi:hypothetical protein D9758_008746 [Tetrapyrgos nigripes]|uniref:2'-phosphotransferase n=1 Tax=Tetrapyrgos nigripes TaxID=182062 RepID=A0A8H5FY62_9AGAR|nr:hypothetical protein D9758_008746 [Tetrapyrgos nigripes]